MANNDYINPEAIRPKYGWQPQGALAGMWSMRDRNRYEDVASLQDMLMKLAAQKEQEDMVMGGPVRQAERQKKLSEADLATMVAQVASKQPGYGQALARGKMGEAGQQEAKGRLDLETLANLISKINAGNRLATTESGIQQERYNQAENPFQALLQNPAHQRDIEKTRMEIGGRENVARIGANATMGAANINANAPGRAKENKEQRRNAVYSVLSQIQSPDQLKPEHQGLVGEGMRFVDEEISEIPAIKNLTKMYELGQITLDKMHSFQEQVKQAHEQAWNNRTAGLKVLRDANPYSKKQGPMPKDSQTNTGIPGVTRLD